MRRQTTRDHPGAPRSSTGVRSALGELLDLAWPQACAGCDTWGTRWCDDCALGVTGPRLRVRPGLAPHLVVHAAAPFEGSLRRAVTVFKDEGRSDIGPVLARLLAVSVGSAIADFATTRGSPASWTLVPVPSSGSATRRRGRFALGELARGARDVISDAGLQGVDAAFLLRSARRTRDQTGLGQEQRRSNVEGAFVVDDRSARRHRCADSGFVLVDDVVTSGATLRAAHTALRIAGLGPVVVATIAATPRRSSVRAQLRSSAEPSESNPGVGAVAGLPWSHDLPGRR